MEKVVVVGLISELGRRPPVTFTCEVGEETVVEDGTRSGGGDSAAYI